MNGNASVSQFKFF